MQPLRDVAGGDVYPPGTPTPGVLVCGSWHSSQALTLREKSTRWSGGQVSIAPQKADGVYVLPKFDLVLGAGV